MERHVPPATHFVHLDLSSGARVRVPLEFLADKQVACKSAALASQEITARVRYSDNLCAEADLQFCGAGSATFTISAAHDFSADVKDGAKLLYGACAVSPILSRSAWYTLGCEFIPVMVGSGRAATPSLPPVPEEYPLGATMLYPAADTLTEDGRAALMGIARVFMAALVNHCRESLARNDDPDIESRYPSGDQGDADGPDQSSWFTSDDI